MATQTHHPAVLLQRSKLSQEDNFFSWEERSENSSVPSMKLKKKSSLFRKTTCMYSQIINLLQCMPILGEIPDMKTHSWRGLTKAFPVLYQKYHSHESQRVPKQSFAQILFRYQLIYFFFFCFLWHACVKFMCLICLLLICFLQLKCELYSLRCLWYNAHFNSKRGKNGILPPCFLSLGL